jgi:hypothetical protein
LGLRVDEELSPALVERLVYLGTKLPSFRDAHEALDVLLRTKLSLKRVERITERIGGERAAQREAEIAAWLRRPLVEKLAAPAGVKPPPVAAVLADGGRLQLRDAAPDAASHWHEYKGGVLHSLASDVSEHDPCPQVPEVFLQRERIDKLAREITSVAARPESLPTDVSSAAIGEIGAVSLISPEELPATGYQPPQVIDRDVVSSRRDSRTFGCHLAARAWSLGFFGAGRKAWIGDGQNWLWTEWERHFKPYGFVPVLDFIHALTHVYAAAMADRSVTEGWTVYVRWIRCVWQGQVAPVIAELAARQQELGLPTPDDGDTSPRTLVSKTLTYLQNQQSRMNYPEYRRQGLPITSAHMESTIKLLNRRVKGSEKYWSEAGAEALLQLAADFLSASQPMTEFWRNRPHRQRGYRSYAKHVI